MTPERRRHTVERIAVPVGTSAPEGRTNAYLVDGLLVDPAARSAGLDDAVDAADVDHVAVTHAHPDHVGAVGEYAAETDATVWARAGYEDRFETATGVEPERVFREGTTVGPATVIDAPGHAPDHVAFALGDEAIVGDLAVAEGSVFVGGTDGDLRAYLTSLRRLLVRGFDRLLPGHGPPIDDPRTTIERLIGRRLDREARVCSAVRAGARTPAEIVDGAYDRDVSDVRDLARLAVEAHLEKLAREGSVRWDGEQATVR